MGMISRMQQAGVVIAMLALGLGAGCGKKEKDASSSTTPTSGNAAAGSAAANTPPPKDEKKEKEPPKEPPKAPANGPSDPNFERFSDVAADNQIDVPKDWGHAPVGDSLLITSPDKQVFIELSASLAMGKDKADEKKLMARLEKSLQKAKRTSPITKAAQNGLTGWKFGGTGEKNGKKYDWESFALEDAAGKGAFGLVYASTADLVSHRAIIDKILGSISAITH